MTREELIEGRRLLEAATPGPWSYWTFETFRNWEEPEQGKVEAASINGPNYWPHPESTQWTIEDAALIVWLANHARELLDAAERPAWTPRAESMPAAGVDVLIAVAGSPLRIQTGHWSNLSHGGLWFTDRGAYEDFEVTHWMPLPAPPEDKP